MTWILVKCGAAICPTPLDNYRLFKVREKPSKRYSFTCFICSTRHTIRQPARPHQDGGVKESACWHWGTPFLTHREALNALNRARMGNRAPPITNGRPTTPHEAYEFRQRRKYA